MNSITRITASVALWATATALQASNAAPVGAIPTGSLPFDVSDNACYQRMQLVDALRARGITPRVDRADRVLNAQAEDHVFGLPVESWNSEVLENFYASLDTCMAPESMKREFGEALVPALRAGFPAYLGSLKEDLELARAFAATQTGPSGATASCSQLLDYHASKGEAGALKFLPPNGDFGKEFANFDRADLTYLETKIDSCTSLLQTVAKSGSTNFDEKIERLQMLRKAIGSDWMPQLANLAAGTAAAAPPIASRAAEPADAPAATGELSMLNKAANYMFKIGMLGFLMCIGLMPKRDKRYKSGRAGNWQMSKPMRIVGACSVTLILLAWALTSVPLTLLT